MAKNKCDLALGLPIRKLNPAQTRPITATRGKSVPINFCCMACKLDSTLAKAKSGIKWSANKNKLGIIYFEYCINKTPSKKT
jgi:hypothetical protein